MSQVKTVVRSSELLQIIILVLLIAALYIVKVVKFVSKPFYKLEGLFIDHEAEQAKTDGLKDDYESPRPYMWIVLGLCVWVLCLWLYTM